MTFECRYCKRTLQRSSWGKHVESERHQTKKRETMEEAKKKWLTRNPGKGVVDYMKYQLQYNLGDREHENDVKEYLNLRI